MSLTQEEAMRQEREEIDIDHLLLGLMREGGSAAILKDMGHQPLQVQALSKEYAKDKPKLSGIDSHTASPFLDMSNRTDSSARCLSAKPGFPLIIFPSSASIKGVLYAMPGLNWLLYATAHGLV